jgi:hypothetical protein
MKIIYPAVKKQLRSFNETTRNEFLGLLELLIATFPIHPTYVVFVFRQKRFLAHASAGLRGWQRCAMPMKKRIFGKTFAISKFIMKPACNSFH